jgi:hypothetical protein
MIPMSLLFSQAKPLDQSPITFNIFVFEVIQEAPALSHQLNQSPTGMVVLGMDLKMIRQVTDALAQDGHLDFRRAGVDVMQPVATDNLLFLFRI